jgi:hypothetical protein
VVSDEKIEGKFVSKDDMSAFKEDELDQEEVLKKRDFLQGLFLNEKAMLKFRDKFYTNNPTINQYSRKIVETKGLNQTPVFDRLHNIVIIYIIFLFSKAASKQKNERKSNIKASKSSQSTINLIFLKWNRFL